MFLVVAVAGRAQYFQFSQYNFTGQRVNPALAAASEYASLGLVYRNQTAGGDVNLKSSLLSAAYPLMSRKTGRPWSGIGIAAMDDRSGGIFSVQEASLSYAVNVSVKRFQSLSLGFKALYQQRSIDLDGLFTGSQFIPDRGFDGSVFNGENIHILRSTFTTFSSGLYWQKTDRQANRVAYWGISIFDFNKPQDSFSGVESRLSSTLVMTGGMRIYEKRDLAITPEVLLTRTSSNLVWNAGAVTSYYIKPSPRKVNARVDILTKYVIGRSGIIGLQFHKDNFSIGCSYDFPVVKSNAGNFSAFEIGLELRKLVKLKRKAIARKKTSKPVDRASKKEKSTDKKTASGMNKELVTGMQADTIAASKPVAAVLVDSSAVIKRSKPDLKTSLQQKQDSVIANAEAGRLRHQPLLIEKVMLHFNFEFNSSALDETSTRYLDDLTAALEENEHLRIRLTGHTDNVGSARFNHRLSVFRANTIKEYLVEKGIDPLRIDTEGKGLTEPLNENRTEEERAKNRRVELMILYEE